MGVLLEINAGPFAGKKIALITGQSVTVGRAAERAKFALPHDTFMSGVHFAVECGPSGCRVQDRKSSNGTFLNGARIQDAMLANGDEIKGGQTIFAVKIVADAKLASLLPPEEVAAPPAAQQRPQAEEPKPRAAEPKPRAAEPQLRAEQPSPPLAPPAARHAEESKPEPVEAVNEAPLSARPSAADPAPAAIRTADVDQQAGKSRPASAEPPVPPPGVAPHIAQKFGDRPASRSAMSPRGAAFSVMGWSFPAAPAEWQVQEGFGLQQSGHEDFPSSVAATEELLGGITLQQFVESQISTLRGYLRDPKIEPTMPPRVGGADESLAVDVRHSTKDGRELVYRRIYARSGASVGVLTVTTLAADFPQVLQTLQPLLDGAAFRATVNS